VTTITAQTVWERHLDLTSEPQPVEWPLGARVIHFAVWEGTPTVWLLADAETPMARRRFLLAATGDPVPPGATYEGTAMGEYRAWHLFTLLPSAVARMSARNEAEL
jgi:hypothetical protein